MRRLLLVLLLFVIVFPAAYAAYAATGDFLLACKFDHAAKDDPIVFPGQPGASHLHSFAGAVGINAYTTGSSLQASASTCNPPGDRSGYWVPAVVKPDGSIVNPTFIEAYYRAAGAPSLAPFPAGLKQVQGNAMNRSGATYTATYRCDSGGAFSVYLPASCAGGSGFTESIYFSRCWDGASLDVPGHHTLGPCDAAHPVYVPQIQMLILWPAAAVGGSLSSDAMAGAPPGVSGHADFFNGWNATLLKKMIDRCLLANISCRVQPNGDVINFTTKAIVITSAEGR